MANERLVISISSFSYKSGAPIDSSDHGGGFIFDCRCITNPGREEAFKYKSGLDPEVVMFLDKLPEAQTFFKNVCAIIDQAVKKYIDRGFTSLSIGFGCTGGQHRSVYFAEKLAAHIKQKFKIGLTMQHVHRSSWLTLQ